MDKRKENIIFAFICVLCVLLCTLLFVLSCCKIYKMDSKLKDKRAIILGDSVARGAVDNGGSELWSKEIEKNIGLLIDNEAVSGTAAGLCDGYGDFSLCEIVNWKPFEKYDICFSAYGTLDYIYQMEIGEPDYLSLNTFYGSYNYSIQKILQVNPNIEIILLTPVYNFQSETENQRNHTMDEYREAIGTIAKKYNLKLIDMKNVLENPELYNEEDMAFPNAEGYEKMGAYIESVIKEEAYSPYPEIKYNAKNMLEDIENMFDCAEKGVLELSGLDIECSLQSLVMSPNEFYYVTIEYDSVLDDVLQIDVWEEERHRSVSSRVFPIEAGEDRIRRIKIAGPKNKMRDGEYYLLIGAFYEESCVQIKKIMISKDGYCK